MQPSNMVMHKPLQCCTYAVYDAAMATQNPRITITLHPETYAIVKELGRLNGESMSATVGGLLDQVAPVLQRIATVLTAAEQAKAAVKDRLADDMEEAQAKMEKSLGVVQ